MYLFHRLPPVITDLHGITSRGIYVYLNIYVVSVSGLNHFLKGLVNAGRSGYGEMLGNEIAAKDGDKTVSVLVKCSNVGNRYIVVTQSI